MGNLGTSLRSIWCCVIVADFGPALKDSCDRFRTSGEPGDSDSQQNIAIDQCDLSASALHPMVSTSFLDVSNTSHFSLQNLPYGVFAPSSGGSRRIGVALGSNVIDLAALSKAGLFPGAHLQQSQCFSKVKLRPHTVYSCLLPYARFLLTASP